MAKSWWQSHKTENSNKIGNHIADIVSVPMNKVRIELSHNFQTNKLTPEYMEEFIVKMKDHFTDQNIYKIHLENYEKVIETGDLKFAPNLADENSQLFWGGVLAYIASNRKLQNEWPENKKFRKISHSSLWKSIAVSSHMKRELKNHAFIIRNSLDNANTKISWSEPLGGGYPNIGYCFVPSQNLIADDMLWSLIAGVPNAAVAINHEIAHSKGTKGIATPKMEILAKEIETLRKRAIKEKNSGNKKDMIKATADYAKKSKEYELRFYFFDELENMFANRYAINQGGDVDKHRLNILETCICGTGHEYIKGAKPIEEYAKDLDSATQIGHIKHAIRYSFFCNNELIEDKHDDWHSIAVYPELINAIDENGTKLTSEESFNLLRKTCNELEKLQPQKLLKLLNERAYNDRMEKMSAARKVIMDKFFDSFILPHLDDLTKDIEKQIQDQQQQQEQMEKALENMTPDQMKQMQKALNDMMKKISDNENLQDLSNNQTMPPPPQTEEEEEEEKEPEEKENKEENQELQNNQQQQGQSQQQSSSGEGKEEDQENSQGNGSGGEQDENKENQENSQGNGSGDNNDNQEKDNENQENSQGNGSDGEQDENKENQDNSQGNGSGNDQEEKQGKNSGDKQENNEDNQGNSQGNDDNQEQQQNNQKNSETNSDSDQNQASNKDTSSNSQQNDSISNGETDGKVADATNAESPDNPYDVENGANKNPNEEKETSEKNLEETKPEDENSEKDKENLKNKDSKEDADEKKDNTPPNRTNDLENRKENDTRKPNSSSKIPPIPPLGQDNNSQSSEESGNNIENSASAGSSKGKKKDDSAVDDNSLRDNNNRGKSPDYNGQSSQDGTKKAKSDNLSSENLDDFEIPDFPKTANNPELDEELIQELLEKSEDVDDLAEQRELDMESPDGPANYDDVEYDDDSNDDDGIPEGWGQSDTERKSNNQPTLISMDEMKSNTGNKKTQFRREGNLNAYEKMIEKWKPTISQVHNIFKKIIEQQRMEAAKKGKSTETKKRMELLPNQGADRLDVTKQMELMKKVQGRDPNISMNDFKRFKNDHKVPKIIPVKDEEIPTVEIGVLIDASGSMAGNPFEYALSIGCILYEASKKIPQINAYIYMMGEPTPLCIAKPGYDDVTIAKNLERSRSSFGGCQDHLFPSIERFMKDVMTENEKNPKQKSGYMHMFSITDGGNNDYGRYRVNDKIKAVMKANEYLTFDSFFIDSGYRNYTKPLIEELRSQGNKRIGMVDKINDSSVIPERMYKMLTQRMKEAELNKAPTNEVKNKLIIDALSKARR